MPLPLPPEDIEFILSHSESEIYAWLTDKQSPDLVAIALQSQQEMHLRTEEQPKDAFYVTFNRATAILKERGKKQRELEKTIAKQSREIK